MIENQIKGVGVKNSTAAQVVKSENFVFNVSTVGDCLEDLQKQRNAMHAHLLNGFNDGVSVWHDGVFFIADVLGTEVKYKETQTPEEITMDIVRVCVEMWKIQNWEVLKRALETNERTKLKMYDVSFIVDVSLLDVNPDGNNKYIATVLVDEMNNLNLEYSTNELNVAAERVVKYVEKFL